MRESSNVMNIDYEELFNLQKGIKHLLDEIPYTTYVI